jgi:type II secretory pathway component PulC
MRLVGALMFIALTGSLAAAEEAAPTAVEAKAPRPKLPLRVVKTLPETHQALVFDTQRHTHLIVEVGTGIDGFTVADIDDDTVTFNAPGGIELVLVATPSMTATATAAPRSNEKTGSGSSEPAPMDPYGEVEPRVVEAPPPVPVVSAAAPAPVVLPRASLDAALANFSTLAGSVHATLTPDGVRLDWVAPDSLFAHAGLAAHDLVVGVDNHPLRSLDDAASLYARAATARNVTIQLVRGAKPIALRVAIE